MQVAKAIQQMRPPVSVQAKKPEDFNRPKVTYAGKTYEPSHPMYETIRRLILERYRR